MVVKRLVSQNDMELWKSSKTFENLVSFITSLAESVNGRENKDYTEPISESIIQVCQLLKQISEIISKHPVLQDANTTRFGKIEFRDFYDDLSSQLPDLVSNLTGNRCKPEIIEELSAYLLESWGDRTRIDYGSGHELNFICFLYILTKLNILSLERDSTNTVLKVFIQYLDIMRDLETKYWLEPAGSHGVWGLDDYHFLPFLFGAFQLSSHKHLKPKSIHNAEVVEMFQDRYLYFGCIAFINKVKSTASLRWHSPMLDDISGVKQWSKVAEGMIKMYKMEVLSKLPIMQHFYFGSVIECPEGVSQPRQPTDDSAVEDSHCEGGHPHNTWGDCCGIPIPSAIAASQMSHKKTERPIPFD